MKRSISVVVALLTAVAIGFLAGYYYHKTRSNAIEVLPHDRYNTYFPIYRLDPNTMKEANRICAIIPDSLDLKSKLVALAAQVSMAFNGRPIIIDSVVTQDTMRIAFIGLPEPGPQSVLSSWYAAFQGSTGGACTQYDLVTSFLQPQYTGRWVDAVQFFYNGTPFNDEWDHIHLSGLKLRDQSRLYRDRNERQTGDDR